MKALLKAIGVSAAFGIGTLLMPSAHAVDYPQKPINLWIAYKPGGGADTLARKIASTIEDQKGWKFVVSDADGASGGLMATKLKYAKPDGYTIGFSTSAAFYLNPLLNKKSKYQSTDFTHLYGVAAVQMAVVSLTERGWKNLDDMAAYAKTHGGLSVAVQGEELKLAAEQIAQHYGIELRTVPTKGGAGSIAQLMGKHIDLGIIAGAHVQYVESGEMVELGVLTEERTEQSPNVPTLREQGVDFVMQNYFQFSAPAHLPANITKQLAGAFEDAMKDPEVRKLAAERMQLDITKPLGPDALSDYISNAGKQVSAILQQ